MDSRHSAFRRGIKDGIPICIGYLSVSFAFGIFCIQSGLTILQAVLVSLTCVTSAGQLAAVPIMTTGGGFLELAMTQVIINLRYSLMSVSLSQKLNDEFGIVRRMSVGFMVTDEIFGVASSQDGKPPRHYFYGLMLTPYFGWALGTFLGAVAGNIFPPVVIASLGIAIYGMFVAIVVPVAEDDKRVALCVLVAIALSCAFAFIPGLNKVPSGFVIIICSVIASTIFAVVAPLEMGVDN